MSTFTFMFTKFIFCAESEAKTWFSIVPRYIFELITQSPPLSIALLYCLYVESFCCFASVCLLYF